MWGQRQSAMLTEASVYAIGPEASLLNKGMKNNLQVVENGILGSYMTDDEIEFWHEQGKRYFDRKFSEELFADINSLVDDFFDFSDKNRKRNAQGLSNVELADLVARQRYFVQQGLVFFATSTPGATWAVEQKMRRILEDKLGNAPRVQDYFITLATPAEIDETMRERIDFIELAKKDGVPDEELLRFAYCYPGMFLNTYDEAAVLSFLCERLEEYRRSKELMQEGKVIAQNVKETASKHGEIYKDIKSEELEYLASLIQRAALGRYRLKHVWSGSEFANLSLLREVAGRIGVDTDDFIRAYMFSDVDRFLRNGTKLSDEEITGRRECMVLHWAQGKLKFLSGREAAEYKDRLVGKAGGEVAGEKKELTGQVASVGKVRGRARVVFVDDLKQFVKDSENFQKGEILVTTMTSPIMMPIIAKAAGIVTDEGGIASHAAVSAREFKISCVVGTKDGTKIIKTGDEIEVDAEKGIVRVLGRRSDI